MEELKNVLFKLITEMKVNEMNTSEADFTPIYLDGTEKDNSKWLDLLRAAIKSAKGFEIHCWNEETDWIEFALKYGTLKDSDWKYGEIIEGEVTDEFINMLLEMPKPTDTEIYNKMTPFFNVFLDDYFQSSHYGTEIYVDLERMK